MTQSPQRHHFRGLDGLRGLAALLVIVHHTILKGTDIGGLAVFLFFILSGFLITGILVRMRARIETGATSVAGALGAFWLQRALRIFPAYYVWLLIFLPFDWFIWKGQTLAHLGWYLVYGQNFLIAFVTHAWQDFTHTWSLAVEQQYYTFFAPLVLLVPLIRKKAFFIIVMALCLAIITAMVAAGFEMITLYPMPLTGFVFMAAGALLSITPAERLRWLAHPLGVVAALALAVLLASYPVLERNNVVKVPYVLLVIGSTAALGTIMAATLVAPASWPVRLLDGRVPRFYGRISYALYIIHLPVALWADEFADLSGLGAPFGLSRDWVNFVVVTGISTALATFSYVVIEQPFLRLKSRLTA